MTVALPLFFAALLLFTNASPHSWDDNSGKIAACAGDANAAFQEPMENCNDDRMITSVALSSRITPPHCSPDDFALIRPSHHETNPTKGHVKIYTRNAAFLI
jgi:hypothetical protein